MTDVLSLLCQIEPQPCPRASDFAATDAKTRPALAGACISAHLDGMKTPTNQGLSLHVSDQGPKDAATVVFVHALGLCHQVWTPVWGALPEGVRHVAVDLRGHGASDPGQPPYAMGHLVKDLETVCDRLALRDVVIVGNSIGGMIAQGLAAKRLDIVRALVLSNTAPKIGTRSLWDDRIAALQMGGTAAIADAVLERWFSRSFIGSGQAEPWRQALIACPDAGYIGCCHAISGTDFYSTTGALRLPTLVVAGTEDRSTPPDLVRELAELIPGSQFQLMRGTGHVPAIDSPQAFATHLNGFLTQIGHLP